MHQTGGSVPNRSSSRATRNSQPTSRRATPVFVDLTPLRESPAFRRLWIGNAVSGIGAQLTLVAVGLHIYSITNSTTAVSLVGAFALVPMVVFGLYGGVLADAFDRRLLLVVSAFLAWGSTITLVVLAFTGVEAVWVFYVMTTVNAVAATVMSTVRFAVVPRLLPAHLLPRGIGAQRHHLRRRAHRRPPLSPAFSWPRSGSAGPTRWMSVLFLSAFFGIFSLPKLPPQGDVAKPGLSALRDGLAFLKRAPNIRVSFLADIIAMTFGQPRVLFPAVGALVLGGGPITVGILTAAGAVGALLSSVFSGRLGSQRWQGRAIRGAITVYGAFVAGFGLLLAVVTFVPWMHVDASFAHANVIGIAIAAVMLAGSGAADNVSSIFRQTILQSAVPDNMRGRLQGVFTVVVTGGPRIGDIYVGLIAAFGALWLPPLLGRRAHHGAARRAGAGAARVPEVRRAVPHAVTQWSGP